MPVEQFTLLIESFIRIADVMYPENAIDVEKTQEFKYNKKAFEIYDNVLRNEYLQAINDITSALKAGQLEELSENNAEERSRLFLGFLDKYSQNPLIVSFIYERSFINNLEAPKSLAKTYLENLSSAYRPAILSLALCSLFQNELDTRYDYLYNTPDISRLFSTEIEWHIASLGTFWLIQAVIHARKDDLKNALLYYDLFASSKAFSVMLLHVQLELSSLLKKTFKTEEVEVR